MAFAADREAPCRSMGHVYENGACRDCGRLEVVYVGCVCNGGKTYARGIMPGMCPHCRGTGSIPREKYRAITAAKSETHRPLEDS